MRIVSWNINGIRAVHKKGLFVPMIEKLKPDILCLQETKAEQGQVEIDLPDYEEYWNSAKKKGYSGTAIMSRVKPLSVAFDVPTDLAEKYKLADDGYGDPNEEGRLVVAEFGDFYVATVYTPNAKDDLSRLSLRHKHWDPAFLAYMKRLEEAGSAGSPQGKPVVFCGDLNVAHTPDDLANPGPNEGKKGFTNEEREGVDNMVEEGFVDTFRMFTQGNGHYTWWSHFSHARERNVGWRIDYVFTSSDLAPLVKRARIHPDVFGSDHCPVSLDLDL